LVLAAFDHGETSFAFAMSCGYNFSMKESPPGLPRWFNGLCNSCFDWFNLSQARSAETLNRWDKPRGGKKHAKGNCTTAKWESRLNGSPSKQSNQTGHAIPSSTDPRSRRLRLTILALSIAVVCIGAMLYAFRLRDVADYRNLLTKTDDAHDVELDAASKLQVRQFCGDCHALPLPSSFPRDAWHDEVAKGYEFYARSGRSDLSPPPFFKTLAFFRSQAPQKLEFSQPPVVPPAPVIAFKIERLSVGQMTTGVPAAVAHLRWSRLATNEAPALLVCDMRQGSVAAVNLHEANRTTRLLAQLNNPCHVEVCDLDGDDALDLVVADLGSYFPADHDLGRVLWLRRRSETSSYDVSVLASGLGRVSDVRAVDVDNDQDRDLIVAEFGNDRTGGIHLLRNKRDAGVATKFQMELLDNRPGTIHLPIFDFNFDSRPDFVALISQEQERLDLFLNHESNRFVRQTLWSAPDLTFASSGIQLVDLDQDGDVDILYTNGDAFDNSYLNPSHGVQWLEQRANLQFAYHRLADLPGAYRALAGDIDLDGDLDIVASTWLPPQIRPENVVREKLASLVYLEQSSAGKFVLHALEVGAPYHAALELADFDSDGDLDIAVGHHVLSGRLKNMQPTTESVTIWWNPTQAQEVGTTLN
jgi:hypothetical protein